MTSNQQTVLDTLRKHGIIDDNCTSLIVTKGTNVTVDVSNLIATLLDEKDNASKLQNTDNFIKQYENDIARTFTYLQNRQLDEMHCVTKICAEAGELASGVVDSFAYGKPDNEVNVFEEMGDVMFFIVSLARLRGWSLRDIIEGNIAKRKFRYPNGFNADSFYNRDKKGEFALMKTMIDAVKERNLTEHDDSEFEKSIADRYSFGIDYAKLGSDVTVNSEFRIDDKTGEFHLSKQTNLGKDA